jgi:hypothetical protein
MDLEEARAAVGPAIELGRHRAPAHAAHRSGSSGDGRMRASGPVGTRQHWAVRFLCRDRERCGRSTAVLVARRGWSDRAMFLPGRGSESYRFLDSVDAQTCCPIVAFNLTRSSMRASPPACQMCAGHSERQGAGWGMPARRWSGAGRDRARQRRASPFTSHNRPSSRP